MDADERRPGDASRSQPRRTDRWPAQVRVLRRRIRSTQSTKKITKAMELIASARIVQGPGAGRGVPALRPSRSPACSPRWRQQRRARPPAAHRAARTRGAPAVLVITSDRGLAGGYNANVLTRGRGAARACCASEGKEPVLYVVGRKGVTYYRFRDREMAETLDRLLRAADLRRRPRGRRAR